MENTLKISLRYDTKEDLAYDLSQVASLAQRFETQGDACLSELAYYLVANEEQLSCEMFSLSRLVSLIELAQSDSKDGESDE